MGHDMDDARDLPKWSGVTPDKAPANPKQAYGDLKDQLALCPHEGLRHQALAQQLGAKKYGPYNWRENKVEAMTYAHAIMRHVQEFIDGVDEDAESGASPLGHIMASCAIVLDAAHQGMLIDNRPRNRLGVKPGD